MRADAIRVKCGRMPVRAFRPGRYDSKSTKKAPVGAFRYLYRFIILSYDKAALSNI